MVEQFFSPFWLNSQILPEGYYIVQSLISPKSQRSPRSHNSNLPRHTFSSFGALLKPNIYSNPALSDGYAKLTVSITKGLAEIYTKTCSTTVETTAPTGTAVPSSPDEDVLHGEKTSSPPKRKASLSALSSCCADDSLLNQSSPLTVGLKDDSVPSTPPFFPFFRAFINDSGVYQSRLIQMGERLGTFAGSRAKNVVLNETGFSNSQDTEILRDLLSGKLSSDAPLPRNFPPGHGHLELKSIHLLDWDEEMQIAIHSPASVLTLQLFEKDFCPDLALSEAPLTSMTVPLAPLVPNQTIHLIMDVICTLPEVYSLENLTSTSPNTPFAAPSVDKISASVGEVGTRTPADPASEPDIEKETFGTAFPETVCAPQVIICKVLIRLRLDVPGSRLSIPFREMTALSLPRGHCTPEALPTRTDKSSCDQLSTLIDSDIFGILRNADEPMSICELIKCTTALLGTIQEHVFSNWSKASAASTFPTGFTYSLAQAGVNLAETEKEILYIAVLRDSIDLISYIIIEPIKFAFEYARQITMFEKPLTSLAVIFVIWAPLFITPRFIMLYWLCISLILITFINDLHIPIKPKKPFSQTGLINKITNVKAAPILVKPIEEALINPRVVLTVHFIELWTKIMKIRIEHYHTQSTLQDMNYYATNNPLFDVVVNICKNPYKLALIIGVAYFSKLNLVIGGLLAIKASLPFIKSFPGGTILLGIVRGFPRYLKLRAIRKPVEDAVRKKRKA